MRKITLEEQEVLFASECKLINLKYEYKGYTGNEKFAIITELSEEELKQKYPDIIERYVPFLLLSMKHGEVIAEAHRNDDKFAKRAKRHGSLFDINDGCFEEHHPELAVNDDIIEAIEFEEQIDQLYEYINRLDETLKRRLTKHYLEEKSMTQIALEEGVSRVAIKKSITLAIKKLKKFYE